MKKKSFELCACRKRAIAILFLVLYEKKGKNMKFWSKKFCSKKKKTIIDNNYTVIEERKLFIVNNFFMI